MQTVQFQCGSCGKLMAVGVEHLGSQVHCPHCMEIVQAPAGDTIALEPPQPDELAIPEIRIPAHEIAEEGSIFGGASDEDLFDAPHGPLVEMPSAAVPVPVPISAPLHNVPASQPEPASAVKAPANEIAAGPPSSSSQWHMSETPAAESELPPQAVRRPKAGNSMLVPMLLIFLIPYSLVCTGYIIYITFLNPPGSPFDPLELMRDPKPNDGGPVRVKPEAPLPGKLKTSLHQPLRVGDLEVTPLKIVSVGGDLVLYLKMQNLSTDLKFNPLPDSFARATEHARPYIFLDSGKDRFYGGYVESRKNGQRSDGVIRPGEENLTLLTSNDKYRSKIFTLLKSQQPLLWRVHVRRGLVNVGGKSVSATAVIGVTFTSQEIVKGG